MYVWRSAEFVVLITPVYHFVILSIARSKTIDHHYSYHLPYIGECRTTPSKCVCNHYNFFLLLLIFILILFILTIHITYNECLDLSLSSFSILTKQVKAMLSRQNHFVTEYKDSSQKISKATVALLQASNLNTPLTLPNNFNKFAIEENQTLLRYYLFVNVVYFV